MGVVSWLSTLLVLHYALGENPVPWAFSEPQDVFPEDNLVAPPPLADSEYFLLYDVGKASKRKTSLRPGAATNTHSCDHVRRVPNELRSATHMGPSGLSTFYQKYTEAYNIPIVASSVVADDALKRSCYIVRFLFADRYDVRNSYYKRFGRMGIIGKNQKTTDMPEHSWLPEHWNTRARGFGATTSGPICTGAEENILCQKTIDRWWDEDIAIHEFAHGVHKLGAYFAINGYNTRLTNAYNSAKSRSLWANTYSMSTVDEYFAEGARAYFNVKPHSSTADGVRNHITTRSQLMSYDRTLYDLIREVFPCGNEYIKRCPANGKTQYDLRRAEAQHNFRSNCAGGTPVTTIGAGDCSDKDSNCPGWVADTSKNYCSTSAYVRDNCKKSCRSCTTGTCSDKGEHCVYWASIGECTKSAAYMNINCQKSCSIC